MTLLDGLDDFDDFGALSNSLLDGFLSVDMEREARDNVIVLDRSVSVCCS